MSALLKQVAGWVWLFAATGAVHAQAPSLAPRGLIWTHSSGAESWVGRVVALSDRGASSISAFGPFTDYTRVFSSYDQNPPLPVWQSTSSEPTFHHAVAAADSGDVQALLYDVYADATLQARRVYIKRISASDPANNWTYQWPYNTNGQDSLTVKMPRDGSRIVGIVHNQNTNKADIKVFSPLSNVPLSSYSIPTSLAFRSVDITADGSRLVIASTLSIQVVNLNTGAIEHSEFLFEPLYSALAISNGGTLFAYGTTAKARIYRRNTNGTYAQDFTVDAPAGHVCDRLDLSDDSSTVVALFNNTAGYHDVLVVAADTTSKTATMSELVHGTGTLQNAAADVSISADGSRFVVALWGDESATTQEVRLYARNQNTPLYVHDLPGSAFDAEISGDGRRFAVASKAVHANNSSGGGRIDLFRSDDEDLLVVGRPVAGSTIEVRHQGNHGQPAVLLRSPFPATTPTFFPSLGTLYIDRATLSYLPMGSFNDQGIATKPLTLPSTPGTKLYLQGFATQPRTLGKTWVGITTVP